MLLYQSNTGIRYSVVVEYPLRDREVLDSIPPEPSHTKDFKIDNNCYSLWCPTYKVWVSEILRVHTSKGCALLCCRFICTNIAPLPKRNWKKIGSLTILVDFVSTTVKLLNQVCKRRTVETLWLMHQIYF